MYEDYEDDRWCPKGGGNTTLIQLDEGEILERTTQARGVRTEGYQESEAH